VFTASYSCRRALRQGYRAPYNFCNGSGPGPVVNRVERHTILKAIVPLALSLCWMTGAEATYSPPRPSGKVAVADYTWHDANRNREVPVRIYYPASGAGPFPVVIFSHGLGGTREGYDYFGRYLAGCDYISVHVQHLGSDDSVWRGKPLLQIRSEMQKSVMKTENVLNRPRDVSFAIDQMLELNAHDKNPFSHRLDANRIAVAGHSFGAFTTLAIAGEAVGGKSLADPRVKAAIAMSAPVHIPQRQDGSEFSTVNIPTLHLTGTRDEGVVFNMRAADRRIPFDQASRAPAFLIIFNGATHMTFARDRGSNVGEDERFHSLINETSIAFLEAYLRGDSAAKQWLVGTGVNQLLGSNASIEKKPSTGG
jgi:predicted dienelactone hydrolase